MGLLFNKHGIVAEIWNVLPYFLAGILLAGWLRTFKVAQKLQASLRRYGAMSVVVASFVGIITPLCACGTLTTAVSLLFAGLPLAPVMALMVTSPLMSPSAYLLTLNDLGPEWTVIRTIAAFAMGIFAGGVTHFLCKRGFDKGGLFVEAGLIRGDFHDEDYPDERLRCNCRERFGNRVELRTSNKFLILLAKSSEMLWLVGKYILVGISVGAVVERYMPYEWIYRFFGGQDALNIVWVTLGSVPVFLHQISASSILSHIKDSLHGTLDGGAGLAFIIGGPVTAVPTMILFWSLFKKRVFVLYMFVCLAGTIMIAYAFQWLVFVPGVDTGNRLLKGVSSLAGGRSAVIRKKSPNVRIALDPGGKSIVATYSNDLTNQGAIVFDAGFDRIAAAARGAVDDKQYVANIADWLEKNGSSQTGGKILVYSISDRKGILDIEEELADVLRKKSFTVTVADRSQVPKLTELMLAEVSQLWLLFADSGNEQQLTSSELDLIDRFAKNGKSMLIAVGNHQDGNQGLTAVNRLASRYGVHFSDVANNQSRMPVGIASNVLATASEILGKLLKIVHKA